MVENEILEEEKKKLLATNAFIKCEKKINSRTPLYLLRDKEISEIIISVFEEIKQYRSIGTVEECREAMERQRVKKPMIEPMAMYANGYPIYICPKCREEATILDPECQERKMDFCANCGQKLDWS